MAKELQLYSLYEIKEKLGAETVPHIIENNEVEKHGADEKTRRIEDFMKREMQDSNDANDSNRIVSHIIFDQDDKTLGFFSHYIKKIRLPKDADVCNSIEVFYVACLARFGGISKEELDVNDILKLAFGVFYNVRELTGGVSTVVLDTDNEKLKNLYIKYGFTQIYNHDNNLFLLQMEMS